jgi:PAS domain S-box-containing protein
MKDFYSTLELESTVKGQKLLLDLALKIRQSLNLDDVLQTTVAEIQQLLKTERVIIYKLNSDGSGVVVAESVTGKWKHLLGKKLQDPCFAENWLGAYKNGKIQAISDIYSSNLSSCHLELLAKLQVRANLVIPIVEIENQTNKENPEKKSLWGLLVAHQCSHIRYWQTSELELLENLSIHIAISIQQAKLYEQLNYQLIKQKEVEQELILRAKAQTLLAQLGQFTLANNNLNLLLKEAINTVVDFFEIPYCGVLELLPNEAALILREAIGWNKDWIGQAISSASAESQVGYTLLTKKPVIVEDIRLETRFRGTAFLHNENIISGVSIIIEGRTKPFGILTVNTDKKRHFSTDDVNFLQSVANIIASEIQRCQAKEELELFFDLSLDLFCMIDLNGYFKRINPSFCQVLGYSEQEFLRQPFINFVHPEDRSITLEEIKKSERGIPTLNFENRYIKADGSICWLSWKAYPYENGLLYGVARDVTKTKETKEKLHASEQNFRQIAENIKEIFFIQDSDSKKLTYVSPAFEGIWGISLDTLYRNPNLWIERIHPEDREEIKYQFENPLVQNYYSKEYRIIRPDGQMRWLWYRTFAVANPVGKIHRVVGIVEDITFRKQAEEELKTINEELEKRVDERTEDLQHTTSRLSALMENLQIGVLVKDEKEGIILANKAFEKIFNPSVCEKAKDCPQGKNLMCYCPHNYKYIFADADYFNRRYQEIISGHEVVMDEEYTLKNGRIIEQSYVPIWVNHEYGGYLWLYRDVTPTKKAEMALRESESKFRAFIQTAGTAIIVLSSDYKILEWNEAAEKISGYQREEVVGENYLLLFLSPQDRKVTTNVINKVINSEDGIKNYEGNLLAKDGSQKLMLWNLNALEDSDNNIVGVIICGHEITVTEKALKDSEEKFRSIFNQAAVGIVQLSISGEFLVMNDKFLQIVNYSEDELKNHDFQYIIHADYMSETLTYLSQLLTKNKSNISIETRIICGDKTVRWVNLAMSLVWESPQFPKYFIGIIQDINDRFIAEEALWDSEERFRAIFEQAAVGMTICNLDGGFFRVNQKFCDIVGYSHLELLQRTFYDITAVKYREENQKLISQLLAGEKDNYSMEKCYVCKDGTVRWVNVLVSLMRDHAYQPKYFIYVVENIGDRKEAERLQGELMRRNNSIVEALGEIVYDRLIPQKKMHWEGHYEKVLGYSEKEIGTDEKSWLDRVYPEDIPLITTEIKRAFKENKIYDLEYRYLHQDGSYRWIYDRGVMHGQYQGKPKQVIGVMRDITERKQAEEKLKASLMEKEVLLKEIHHRVKNNLYVISSLLNIQSTYVQDPEVIEFFQDSKNRIQTMAIIHEQLYLSDDLAQIDFKEYLHRLVNNLLSSYNPDPDRIKAIIDVESLHLDLEIAIPCGLLVNELVTNAFKHAFTDKTSGKLKIKLHQDKTKKIHLIVQDNGQGMPENFNIEEADSLGLRLVRILTEQLDGELTFKTSNRGTSFHLKLVP